MVHHLNLPSCKLHTMEITWFRKLESVKGIKSLNYFNRTFTIRISFLTCAIFRNLGYVNKKLLKYKKLQKYLVRVVALMCYFQTSNEEMIQ